MSENKLEFKTTLEERKCLCGCGMTFRVMPTSKNQYASILHMPSGQEFVNNNKFKAEFASAIKERDILVEDIT